MEPQQETATGPGPDNHASHAGRSPFESFGRKVDEHLGSAGPRIEEEVRRVIDYLNDEVVPQVRRQSSTALRYAASELGRLAEHLERRHAASAASATAASEEPAPGNRR